MEISDMWDSLITEIEKLEEKYKLSQNLPEDYFEPAVRIFFLSSFQSKSGTTRLRFCLSKNPYRYQKMGV